MAVYAVPDPGYVFSRWTGDVGGTYNPLEITLEADKTIGAEFVPSTDKWYLDTTVSPDGGGTINLSPTQPVGGYLVSTQVTVTAVPATGYRFVRWEGDLTGSNNPATVLMSKTKTVTAVFEAAFMLTVSTVPAIGGGGTVQMEPASSEGYARDTVVTLTAIPDEGYQFDYWSGNLSGTANPATVTMDASKTVTAHFVKESGFPVPLWLIIVALVGIVLAIPIGAVVFRRMMVG